MATSQATRRETKEESVFVRVPASLNEAFIEIADRDFEGVKARAARIAIKEFVETRSAMADTPESEKVAA